ncbi:hypothetical protein D6445_11785 [Salmonella enterica subsp. enterica serovar Infantis]|nr:hypothetical protein [Salmonella enterica subsp. enterica serovar Infantis]EGI5923290.1 hypothetical protein [Salmonella enterica subsp. enterica serovar Colindale]
MVGSVSFGGVRSLDFYTAPKPGTLPPGTTATSGQLCPQTGIWQSESYQVTVGVSKGDVMPQYQCRNIDWSLVEDSSDKSPDSV